MLGLTQIAPNHMQERFRIKTSALFGLDVLLQELNVDADAWLAHFSLSMDDINQDGNTMDIGLFVQLLQASANKTACHEFGVKLGAKQDFRILGPLGLLLQNCKTPREALNAARGFMSFHNQSEYWDYTVQGDALYLKRYEIFHELPDTRQYKELSFSACYQLCKLLMGETFKGTRIEFSHSPVSTRKTYERYFNMPVHFDCEQDMLVVPAHYLDSPIEDANQMLKGFAHHYLNSLKRAHGDDIEHQVATLIQQTMSLQDHSIDKIAQLLHMSKRTLQRRLKEKGIVFKTLLSDIRIKTAKWYLTSSRIDITLLSEMLGYSDVSAFSRAFKKSVAQAPLEWRKANKTPD